MEARARIIGAVVAAPFGLIDWLAIPTGTRAKTVGMIHGLGTSERTRAHGSPLERKDVGIGKL